MCKIHLLYYCGFEKKKVGKIPPAKKHTDTYKLTHCPLTLQEVDMIAEVWPNTSRCLF